MNKRQIIDEIRQHNTHVNPQFLAQFNDTALSDYLTHLQSASKRHVTVARFVRNAPNRNPPLANSAQAHAA
jgi:hypothetical protein